MHFDSTCTCSRRSALKAGFTAAVIMPSRAASVSPDRDTVLLDEERQIIDNFAASDCWSMQKIGAWSLSNRSRIADLLFSQIDGIGLSCWRFNIGAGINPRITNPWRTAETFEVAPGEYDWARGRKMSDGSFARPNWVECNSFSPS
jgi:O-Glycosyl hydrolase family 30